MSKYTVQSELDLLGLGARWGCAFCGLINVIEHLTGDKLTEAELDTIIGHTFRKGYSHLCNYIDHSDLEKTAGDCKTWDEKDNPEWHYYVNNRTDFILYLEQYFSVRIPYDGYKIAIMRTQYGGLHYCIKAKSGELINPDVSLKGPIVEERQFVY